MRKFTFIFSLLVTLAAVSMAQTVVTTIKDGALYTLQCKSSSHGDSFIGVADGVVNGRSRDAALIKFENGTAENSYYIKVGKKYINYDGTNLSASEEKSTAWILGAVGETVTFNYPGSTKYLNNNTTNEGDAVKCLQAANHPAGPNAGNACSTWEMKEYYQFPVPGDDYKADLPGVTNGKQYCWKSEKQTAPEGGFNKLRITFLQNSSNSLSINSGFPYVTLAEFYLFDKGGNRVELTADRFSSNATQSGEGSIESLCDGVTTAPQDLFNWYWHSEWSGTPNPYGYHYLEVNLEGLDTDLSEYSFGWVTRREDASPKEILIAAGASSEDVQEKTNSAMLPQLSTGCNIKLYTIQSVRSKKYIASEADNKQLIQTNNTNQRSALWYFTEGTDGKVVMHNLATTQVVGNNCVMGESGEWKFLPAIYRPGVVISQNNYSGNCFDEQSGKVGTWGHSANDNEGTTWLFQEVKGVSELSGKVIASIGGPATEIESGKWYILNNVGRENIVSQEGNNLKMRAINSVAAGSKWSEDNAGYLFQITEVGDGKHYYINSGNGIYFKLGQNSASTSDKPVMFSIGKIGESEDIFYLYDEDNKHAADGQETGYSFVGWSSSVPTTAGGNDSYRLLPVDLDPVYIYEYYMDNRKIASETIVDNDNEFSNLDHHYGVSAVNLPEGFVEPGAYKIDITDNLPFEYASSYKDIEKWYYVKLKGANYLYHEDEKDHIALDKAAVDVDNKDAYSWAFVGNPIDGYQFVNKAAGEGYVLSSTTNITDDANTFPVMTATPVPDGNNELWVLSASTHQTNGFFMGQKGYSNNRMNNRGSKLAYWTGGADNGSTFTVEERRSAIAALIALVSEAQTLLSQIHIGESIGLYSSSYEGYEDAYSEIAAYVTAGEMQEDVAEEYLLQLTEIIASFSLNGLKAGKYYTLSNGGYYITSSVVDNRIFCSPNDDIYYFDGEHLLAYNTGLYFGLNSTDWTFEAVGSADISKITFAAVKGGTENVLNICSGGRWLHRTDNYVNRCSSNTCGEAHEWTIAEVKSLPVTITGAKYATFYAPVAVEIHTDAKAYTVTIDGDKAILSELSEKIVPANTGVVLYSESAPENGAVHWLDVIESNATVENNALNGTVAATNVTTEAYVLSAPNGNVGFYKAAMNNGSWLNNSHKAYLPMPEGAQGVAYYSFTFDFEGTTGIENVQGADAETVIYDLTGRRVQQMNAAGIYIVNGKKVLVK